MRRAALRRQYAGETKRNLAQISTESKFGKRATLQARHVAEQSVARSMYAPTLNYITFDMSSMGFQQFNINILLKNERKYDFNSGD